MPHFWICGWLTTQCFTQSILADTPTLSQWDCLQFQHPVDADLWPWCVWFYLNLHLVQLVPLKPFHDICIHINSFHRLYSHVSNICIDTIDESWVHNVFLQLHLLVFLISYIFFHTRYRSITVTFTATYPQCITTTKTNRNTLWCVRFCTRWRLAVSTTVTWKGLSGSSEKCPLLPKRIMSARRCSTVNVPRRLSNVFPVGCAARGSPLVLQACARYTMI